MEEDIYFQVFILEDKTEDDFILKLCSNEKHLKYIVKVLNKNKDNMQVKFLRKKDNASLFYHTDQLEIYFVDMEDIIMK